ncbi:MAG: RIP metalloprotease RseP [Clostridiales bacterium]|nr:RIP metalloprotease RseP [Clostridiales bacterium]
MVLYIVYAILIFLMLIFVHEAGHLISAKISKIRVNEFALGMGPKIFGFTKGDTQYSFRAIPFGGYCAMEGENDESDDPRAFGNKPARVRAFVLFAGSVMNILLAIIVISLLIFYVGTPSRVLAAVEEDKPAYSDGLRAGDELVAINGQPVSNWDDIVPRLREVAALDPEGNEQLVLTVMRDGAEKTIKTHFYKDANGDFKVGIIPAYSRDGTYFFKSFGKGTVETLFMTKMLYEVLRDLFTGKAGMEMLTGPVGIVVTVGEVAPYGAPNLFYLMALISLNLGIINLVPFPALDGGRLLFLLIRKITGKAITDEIEGRVHLVGILVLFGFLAIITFLDIDRFIIN